MYLEDRITHSGSLYMFSEILRATGSYTDHEAALFEAAVTTRHAARNEFLLQKGEVAKSIYFLLSGSAFQYQAITDAEHNIIDLHLEKDWFLNYESLLTQHPSEVYIQTFSDCQVLELNLETVHYLTRKSVAFLQLNRVLEGAATRLRFFDQAMTPAEKYSFVLTNRPRLIQVFPLKMISSYLKITPETLSRVRKSIIVTDIS